MTSSLVGSEMCIRDSHGPEQPSLGRVHSPAVHPDDLGAPIGPWHPAAVSYTHLTLPTICSV
eukprot:2642201-Prorocentrum_lima.AAC.1